MYERVREERAETRLELAAVSRRAMHIGESTAKEERDTQFAALKEWKGAVSDRRTGADLQKRIYDDDRMKVTQDSLGEIFASL